MTRAACRMSAASPAPGQGGGLRVEVLGQPGVDRGHHDQGGDANGRPGPAGSGVGTCDGPGEQVTGRKIVQVDRVVEQRAGQGGRVQRGERHQQQASGVEHGGAGRMTGRVQDRRAQQAGDAAAVRHRRGAQQQRDRRGHDQGQGSEHPDQQVLDHVAGGARRGQGVHERGERHGQHGAAGQPGGAAQAAPAPGGDRRPPGRDQVDRGAGDDRQQHRQGRLPRAEVRMDGIQMGGAGRGEFRMGQVRMGTVVRRSGVGVLLDGDRKDGPHQGRRSPDGGRTSPARRCRRRARRASTAPQASSRTAARFHARS